MKNYSVDIAPGYGSEKTASLTDGKHGCTVSAENMESAIAKVAERAKKEGWPTGEAMVSELNALGQRVEDAFCRGSRRIKI